MPVNRSALIRYRILDQCFRNKQRKYDLEELMDTCADGLYEYAGIRGGVSRRTIQLDIQMMRSDQLGYNAPIEVYDRKFYRYSDPNYSITKTQVSESDIDRLYEVVDLLRQFSGFNRFEDISELVQRLEDKITSQRTREYPIIELDRNKDLRGVEFLDQLYHGILSKRRMNITYQSFKARSPRTFEFHAFLLKEFNNRWFVLGRTSKAPNQNQILALDRIRNIVVTGERRREFSDLDPSTYFDDFVGVTKSENPKEKIRFLVKHDFAGYIETKPVHASQKKLSSDKDGVTFEIEVRQNLELLARFLSYGAKVKVLSPMKTQRMLKSRIKKMLAQYTLD